MQDYSRKRLHEQTQFFKMDSRWDMFTRTRFPLCLRQISPFIPAKYRKSRLLA